MRFINRLKANIQDVLSAYSEVTVRSTRDRTHVLLNGADDRSVIEALKPVFGIQGLSPVYKVEKVSLY